MILFKLRCTEDHEFEAWFRDNAAYDRQHSRGQIACPSCGTVAVEKALMAPRLGRSRSEAPQPEPARAEPAPPEPAAPAAQPTPAQLRRALQEMRRQVERNCDYVGPKFAEEARKMHRGDARARGIYGEATPAESRALADEGIEVASIPWVPPNDA
ncbi:MAG TPA: DUF1178 family protein [Stellaceae bacterium]|nr:DUF1178 family protein [Stellaceae bacterium]